MQARNRFTLVRGSIKKSGYFNFLCVLTVSGISN